MNVPEGRARGLAGSNTVVEMTTAAVVTAIVFGALVGWGLGQRTPGFLAPMTALLVGFLIGVVGFLTETAEPMAAGSLTLGCAAGSVAFLGLRLRRPTS